MHSHAQLEYLVLQTQIQSRGSWEELAWFIIRLVKNRTELLRNAADSSSSEENKECFLPLGRKLFLPLRRRLDQTDSGDPFQLYDWCWMRCRFLSTEGVCVFKT